MSRLLIYGSDILAVDPVETEDVFTTSDQIIPKHVIHGYQLVNGTIPLDGQRPASLWICEWDGEKVVLKPVVLDPEVKARANAQINEWREAANYTSFSHLGKDIACDSLSRSDIDAVSCNIALTGDFPAGFPGGWKAIDNTYIPLPDIASFAAMYSSMTAQGTINFAHSQDLKGQIALANTKQQLDAIHW